MFQAHSVSRLGQEERTLLATTAEENRKRLGQKEIVHVFKSRHIKPTVS